MIWNLLRKPVETPLARAQRQLAETRKQNEALQQTTDSLLNWTQSHLGNNLDVRA